MIAPRLSVPSGSRLYPATNAPDLAISALPFDAEDAPCTREGADPEAWFPDTLKGENRARALCRGCPVIDACWEFACAAEGTLIARARYGIFGGATPNDRAAGRKPRSHGRCRWCSRDLWPENGEHYCGAECEHAHETALARAEAARVREGQRAAAAAAVVGQTKPCQWCGETFRRGSNSASKWEARRYCSPRCGGLARRRPVGEEQPDPCQEGAETKPCEGCGAVMVRGPRTARQTWERRRWCGEACYRRASRAKKAAAKTG